MMKQVDRKKMIGAGAGVLCFLMAFFTGCAGAVDQEKVFSIAVIRPAASYAIEIEQSLKKHLGLLGYVEGENLVYLPTEIVKETVEDFPETARRIMDIVAGQPDIIATIGTQASVPTWQVVSSTYLPMVFCGVTYPVEGGLIKAFGKPTLTNITGISYFVSTRKRVELIRKLFPDMNRFKKIAFLYSGQVLNDFTYARHLASLQGEYGWEFVLIDYYDYAQHTVSIKKMMKMLQQVQPDLAFGWYSFNALATSPGFARFSSNFNKPFLAITDNMIEFGAIGGFIADHQKMGKNQADMIDLVLKGTYVGSIPPKEQQDYILKLNLKRAEDLGITFPADLLQSSKTIYE